MHSWRKSIQAVGTASAKALRLQVVAVTERKPAVWLEQSKLQQGEEVPWPCERGGHHMALAFAPAWEAVHDLTHVSLALCPSALRY